MDSYRRFIHMFGTTVVEIEHRLFEERLSALKDRKKVKLDTELTADDLEVLCNEYK